MKTDTFACAWCGKDWSLTSNRTGGPPRRFCPDTNHGQLWRNRQARCERHDGGISRSRNCPRCREGRVGYGQTHCSRCRQEAKRNATRGHPRGNPELPLPPDFDQRRRVISALLDPHATGVVCYCGLDAEVQGIYDYRVFETRLWEVCPRGHRTRIEPRRVA